MESFKLTSRALLIAIAITGFGVETFGAHSRPKPVRHQSGPEAVAIRLENLKMCLAEATANPQSPEVQYRLGRAYLACSPLELSDAQKAINAFKEAIALKPDF